MKKSLPLLILFLVILLFFFRNEERPVAVSKKDVLARPLLTTHATTAVRPPLRAPAQIRSSRGRSRPDLRKSFAPDRSYDLGKSYVLTRDIGAVPRDAYSPDLGTLVYEDKNWSYFKKAPNDHSVSVAYQPSRNRFLPVSSVLTVKDVTPEQRQELKSSGLEEYHYLKNLNLLFIESSPEEVLKTYEELKQKGLKVQLEVLSERAKAH